jgi:hypothetical protein
LATPYLVAVPIAELLWLGRTATLPGSTADLS